MRAVGSVPTESARSTRGQVTPGGTRERHLEFFETTRGCRILGDVKGDDVPSEARETAPAQRRLLIVDDDAGVRRSHGRFFGKNHDIAFAGSVAEALALIASDTLWSGALLDVALPDGDGIQVLKAFRERCWIAPVLMLTGHTEATFINRAQVFGAQYAVKPADGDNFRAFAGRLLASSQATALEVAVSHLASEFDLTPHERRIVELVARGVPRDELARALGVGENGLKQQVRRVVRKCGQYHLNDLARIVWQHAAR